MNRFFLILKAFLPTSFRKSFRLVQKRIVYFLRRQLIRIPVLFGIPIKVIVGAAMTSQHGWYSTNEEWLDISSKDDWETVFKGKRLIKHLVAEHVFEHLTSLQTKEALQLISRHMISGGTIRIAVPDGNHPSPTYIKHVGVQGIGADAQDHKQLINVSLLKSYMRGAGFKAELKEGYLKNGRLVQKKLELEMGFVTRSRSNRNAIKHRKGWDFVDSETSLVVDGFIDK